MVIINYIINCYLSAKLVNNKNILTSIIAIMFIMKVFYLVDIRDGLRKKKNKYSQ